jgi:hypothetical protein
MSTLNVSNITDGTTTVGTSYVVNGSAKAWVNFNGTGTIAARDSLNLSSLTDNGTGDYSVNFSNNFGAVDYVPQIVSGVRPSASSVNWASGVWTNTAGQGIDGVSTSSLRVATNKFSHTTGFNDDDLVSVTAHGDLA